MATQVTEDRELQVMAGIAAAVAALSIGRPQLLARILLLDPDELTGTARFALRLFATRNAWIVWRSLAGDVEVQEAYVPVQYLDQAVFWGSALDGSIPKRSAALAATISGAIIVAGQRRAARADQVKAREIRHSR